MAKSKNPFDSIDRLTLTEISDNPNPITIEFISQEYFRDKDGCIIPTKCTVNLTGKIRVGNELDELHAKIARKVLKAIRLGQLFVHGKYKWYKIHHDMVSLIFGVYKETDDWEMRIKTVENKSSRKVYEECCKYFDIDQDPKEEPTNAGC